MDYFGPVKPGMAVDPIPSVPQGQNFKALSLSSQEPNLPYHPKPISDAAPRCLYEKNKLAEFPRPARPPGNGFIFIPCSGSIPRSLQDEEPDGPAGGTQGLEEAIRRDASSAEGIMGDQKDSRACIRSSTFHRSRFLSVGFPDRSGIIPHYCQSSPSHKPHRK